MYAIETSDLTKRYSDLVAVDHLNLKIKKGEIFGYLGHNGSGKTTTIMMLCGLVAPSKGSATVAGFDLQKEVLEVKKRIGFLPENTSYYENLTARQNLKFFGELAGLDRIKRDETANEVLELVGLEKWKDTTVGKFSKGMQQRLGIAQALVRDPEVIFLDEPTSGLDPQGAKEIRDLILKLSKEEGKTIFLSSHILAEVKYLCDKVGILKQGRLIALDSIDNLANQLNLHGSIFNIALQTNNNLKALGILRELVGIEISNKNGKILIHANEDFRKEIFHKISDYGLEILELKLLEPALEELFLKAYEVEGV